LSVEKLPNIKSNKPVALVIDGIWFKKTRCGITYLNHLTRKPVYWSFYTSEKFENICLDLYYIKKGFPNILGFTADGGKGINSAVSGSFPELPKQRCLAHIRRRINTLTTRNPKTNCGWDLKTLMKKLFKIENKKQKKKWIKELNKWKEKYHSFLKEKTYNPETKTKWWYTHRRLRACRSHLNNALPFMFTYLDHNFLPKTSNGLEGRNSAIKKRFKDHSGLKREKYKNFFFWYLYFLSLED